MYYCKVNGYRRELTVNVFTGKPIFDGKDAHNNARWIAKQEGAKTFEVHCENDKFHVWETYEKILGCYIQTAQNAVVKKSRNTDA